MKRKNCNKRSNPNNPAPSGGGEAIALAWLHAGAPAISLETIVMALHTRAAVEREYTRHHYARRVHAQVLAEAITAGMPSDQAVRMAEHARLRASGWAVPISKDQAMANVQARNRYARLVYAETLSGALLAGLPGDVAIRLAKDAKSAAAKKPTAKK